jgi:RNA ligase (TIGR02306 family)
MSKLASVQKIVSISPIEGADAIECVTVLGWQVVTKKGEYQNGELCCYVQIDTIVPELPKYDFLRERKYRVRTIKLRGQVSAATIFHVLI